MKKILLSLCLVTLGTSLSFSQQQEETENAPEIKTVEVKTVKAKKIKKSEKIEAVKVEAINPKKVVRKEEIEVEGKKED